MAEAMGTKVDLLRARDRSEARKPQHMREVRKSRVRDIRGEEGKGYTVV